MDVSAPYRSVVAGLDGDVLVLLAGTRRPMTGRQLADALGQRSHDGVRKSLERLVRQGIVDREPAGNALMHSLNREHVGSPAVLALANMRTELWQRLRETIAAWDVKPAYASVFGSAARGDGTAASDIDLLIVRPDDVDPDDDRWRDQLALLADQVRAWTGNPASIIEQGEREMREMAAATATPAVLGELRRDSIDLAGPSTRELLRGVS